MCREHLLVADGENIGEHLPRGSGGETEGNAHSERQLTIDKGNQDGTEEDTDTDAGRRGVEAEPEDDIEEGTQAINENEIGG